MAPSFIKTKLHDFFIVILTPFRWPTMKGQRLIYTKVSHPCQVRSRRGNVTKIELALPLLFLPGTGPRFAISDVSSCPDGLMPRKIENPWLRKPDILASSSELAFLSFSILPSGRYWCDHSLKIILNNLSSLFFINHDLKNKTLKY